MQVNNITSCRFKVAGSVLLAATLLTGCSAKHDSTPAETSPAAETQAMASAGIDDSDLLLRVRFSGTAALIANTNAAYLTNIAALPETAALGKRIVERFASLPERLIQRGTRNAERGTSHTNLASTLNHQPSTNALEPMFADLLRSGFVLELRGDSNGVTSLLLGAKANAEAVSKWNKALADAAKEWFGEEAAPKTGTWSADNARMQVQAEQNSVVFGLANKENFRLSTFNLQQITSNPTNILEIEMSSVLLPSQIHRSVYGGFERLTISVFPDNQSLKVRGRAMYAKKLPNLSVPPVVPTNLVTEPVISFTMVRNPDAWLEPESALRQLLPVPVPDTAYFWGGESSPHQLFIAMPFGEKNGSTTNFGTKLGSTISRVAAALDSGPVTFDTNSLRLRWEGLPFVAPQISFTNVGTNDFLVGELFPSANLGSGLTPMLLDRVSRHTNQVLFDWEFTQLRVDTWFRIGQLALFASGHEQLGANVASTEWIVAIQKLLPEGGNIYTDITQQSPYELTLIRRGPVAFTSIELFWLGNWLESSNFPHANFLTPAPQPDWGTGGQ